MGILLTFASLYTLTFLWHGVSRTENSSMPAFVFTLALYLAGTFLVARMDLREAVSSKAMVRILKILILTPGLLGLALLADLSHGFLAALANLGFLGFSVWLIREGVKMGNAKKINGGVTLIGLLVFTRFFDYFGTMLQSGIAFILTGLFFVGAAWLLNQGRKKLLAASERGRP